MDTQENQKLYARESGRLARIEDKTFGRLMEAAESERDISLSKTRKLVTIH